MSIPDPILYGLVVGALSAGAVVFSGWRTSRAATRGSGIALEGVQRQIELQRAVKVAEFRQDWINDLRESMAKFQSMGVTPNLDHALEPEFYRLGTKIELLMNREDQRYAALQGLLYQFLEAKSTAEKYACNVPYIELCQDILKTEWDVLKRDLAAATQSRRG
jgi:hypothetical protein